jgi:hypothetical protein
MLYKIWDKLKSQGKPPTLDNNVLNSLGFTFRDSEPRFALTHWLGGYEKVKKDVIDSLLGKTFNTEDYKNNGGILMTFYVGEIEEYDEDQTLQIRTNIIDGTLDWYDEETDEYNRISIADAYDEVGMGEAGDLNDALEDVIYKMLKDKITDKTGIDVWIQIES